MPHPLNLDVLSNPAMIRLGIGTTLQDTKNTFALLHAPGQSYTGGPIFRISPYELSTYGILGAELAFDCDDNLDAIHFKFEKVHYQYLLEHFQANFRYTNSFKREDRTIAIFHNGHIEIALDPHSSDNLCCLSYASHAFKSARTFMMSGDDWLPDTP